MEAHICLSYFHGLDRKWTWLPAAELRFYSNIPPLIFQAVGNTLE